jgi:hypothetical protein
MPFSWTAFTNSLAGRAWSPEELATVAVRWVMVLFFCGRGW